MSSHIQRPASAHSGGNKPPQHEPSVMPLPTADHNGEGVHHDGLSDETKAVGDQFAAWTPPFPDLLREAFQVQNGDRIGASAVLASAIACTRGESAQIYDALAGAVGMDKRTIASMHFDEKCKYGGCILRRSSEIAEAMADWLRSLVPNGNLIHALGQFWEYDPSEAPYYMPVKDEAVQCAIENCLPHHPILQTETSLKEVTQKVARRLSQPDFFTGARHGFNMRNGFVVINPNSGTAVLEPHDPEHRARNMLEADFDPNAVCPVFRAGLELMLPDAESRDALQEAGGCALGGITLPGDNGCSMILILGPPNSGKSSFLGIAELFFPESLRGALQPKDMGEKFMLSSVEGIKINIVYELETSVPLGGSQFKAVLSRERLQFRKVRQDPRSFVPDFWTLAAGNEPPRLKDITGAYDRRMSTFKCPLSLTREQTIPNYREQVRGELAGIVNWSLEGVQRAIARGYFAKSPEHAEIMAEMRGGSDIIMEFVSRVTTRCDRSRPAVTNQMLFEAAKEYASARGTDLSDITQTSFGRRMAHAIRRIYGIEQEPTKAHGGRPQYRGIQILPSRAGGIEYPTPASLDDL